MNVTCNQFGGNSIADALNAKVYGNRSQTMVLAHGFGTDQTLWNLLIPYLACYFKVVVFDLVFAANVDPVFYHEGRYSGFEGYAKDLTCLLDELNVDNSIYVGHSMSAMVGGLASTMRPELFSQLVLLSGSPRYLNDQDYIGGFEMPELDMIFDMMSDDFPSWVNTFAPNAVGVNSSAAIAKFKRSLGRMEPSTALSVAKTVFLSDLRAILPQISVPSLVIQSREDSVVPESVAFYMETNLGGPAMVKILETKGHFPQLTAYGTLLKALEPILSMYRQKKIG